MSHAAWQAGDAGQPQCLSVERMGVACDGGLALPCSVCRRARFRQRRPPSTTFSNRLIYSIFKPAPTNGVGGSCV